MIADYGLGRGSIGTDLMPYMVYEELRQQFPDCQSGPRTMSGRITAVKHPLEIELIRDAVRVADCGVLRRLPRSVQASASMPWQRRPSMRCTKPGPSSSRSFR